MKKVYLILCILGTLLPFCFFIPWLIENGVDLSQLVVDVSSSKLSLFAWADVLISAIALICFIRVDGRRQKMDKLWAPVLATCFVGVSLGLPLFLLMREYQRDKNRP